MIQSSMQIPLQQWANEHEPSDEMLYKKGYWHQILFVRDQIPTIFAVNYEEYEAIRTQTFVVSTHVSKSIRLPVFQVNLQKIGVTLLLRYNFYDWKVSVVSTKPITTAFGDLLTKAENIQSIYCEGFDDEWVFPSYKNNPQTFTVEINDFYKLHTFLWLIKQQLL